MLKPLNKNIVLKKEEIENKTASGIILTTETKSLPTVGEVVAVGPQCENDLKEKDAKRDIEKALKRAY